MQPSQSVQLTPPPARYNHAHPYFLRQTLCFCIYIPPLKKRNGSGTAQSEFEKAEEFNGQFSDVFTKSEYKQVRLMDRSAPFMHDIVVTKEGVTKLLKGLNPS